MARPPNKNKALLAKNIVALRKMFGFTTTSVAESIGLSRTALSDIESGRVTSPNFVNVARLARLYGVTPTQLYDDDLTKAGAGELALNYAATNLDDVKRKFLISIIDGWRKEDMEDGYFQSLYMVYDPD